MGKLKLAGVIAMRAHKLLHNFNQHPGRIDLQLPVVAGHNLIPQSPKGTQTIFHLTAFERLQQMNNGISNPEAPGFSHLLYSTGMQVMKKPPLSIELRDITGKHFVDNLQESVIPLIEKNTDS
jgi:hypothetical protein